MVSLRTVMNSKIHRATVTEADINYIGSITIDEELVEAANISEWEKIEVLNITNGSRLETYVILGERGSGEICINGAAAHLVNPGDLVILVTYKTIEEEKINVVIDETSMELIQNSTIDYVHELIGSSFKITNPQASSSCGCGTSFSI